MKTLAILLVSPILLFECDNPISGALSDDESAVTQALCDLARENPDLDLSDTGFTSTEDLLTACDLAGF